MISITNQVIFSINLSSEYWVSEQFTMDQVWYLSSLASLFIGANLYTLSRSSTASLYPFLLLHCFPLFLWPAWHMLWWSFPSKGLRSAVQRGPGTNPGRCGCSLPGWIRYCCETALREKSRRQARFSTAFSVWLSWDICFLNMPEVAYQKTGWPSTAHAGKVATCQARVLHCTVLSVTQLILQFRPSNNSCFHSFDVWPRFLNAPN